MWDLQRLSTETAWLMMSERCAFYSTLLAVATVDSLPAGYQPIISRKTFIKKNLSRNELVIFTFPIEKCAVYPYQFFYNSLQVWQKWLWIFQQMMLSTLAWRGLGGAGQLESHTANHRDQNYPSCTVGSHMIITWPPLRSDDLTYHSANCSTAVATNALIHSPPFWEEKNLEHVDRENNM